MSVFISLFTIALNAILAENFILVKFMGICPFMGVSKKQDTALGMGIAVTFVMGIASAATWAVNEFLLVPLNLVYMQTVVFILVIAALVQLVEMFLQKAVPALYQALGIYLPLITTNCAVLGVALLSLGEKAKVFTSFIDQGSDVMLKIVEYIMAVSPIGIASLMATMVSTISGATMKEVVSFIIMDYGCGITILLIVYPLLIKLLARVPVISFMKKISEPMIVAVTTTSSAATLPISIKVAGEKLGVPENIYGFTLPLGNTCAHRSSTGQGGYECL